MTRETRRVVIRDKSLTIDGVELANHALSADLHFERDRASITVELDFHVTDVDVDVNALEVGFTQAEAPPW
jgi:hypothetical protein